MYSGCLEKATGLLQYEHRLVLDCIRIFKMLNFHLDFGNLRIKK